ncbi:MAG: hypothetical protein Tp1124DCM412261_6 [Prokaryotic dsDNA virus sp.]|nr:MAG: hypothetical protein Tp1123DCM939791_28 [Prokaryotic dsDNA virus sp.]QDP59838.1 MAG: hypothetical protein Tp1124DCM412261_6 [Prokaryotic dsDNA virus sp.]|tara:strand:- start:764 stop:1390 length:627 start_codon:yes stop_codon:yes gene_type:complete
MTPKQLIKKYKLEKGIHADYYEHFQSKKTVLTHRACEKIAGIEGIIMKAIQVLNSERDFARFLVTMELGEKTISSVGEADNKNCKNMYYGCMAEKRGVDRCVLKLIDAHEFAFSEVDFADHNAQNFEVKPTATPSAKVEESTEDSPPSSSTAWRNEKFKPLDTKIKNISNDDCKFWRKADISDKRSAELIQLEFQYRLKKHNESRGEK